MELLPTHKQILKDISWPLKVDIYKNVETIRPVGIQYLTSGRREYTQADKYNTSGPRINRREYTEEDEYNLRVKLFRIMYEIVRENDEQIKTAEDIISKFTPSSYIQIGFILSIVLEKQKDMKKVADTLSRLKEQWSALEHVDAYEQIVNIHMEINNLLEIFKVVYKDHVVKGASKKAVRNGWSQVEDLIVQHVQDVVNFETEHGAKKPYSDRRKT